MRALVLSGGGGLGAYQVGVLKHLLGDLGIQYPLVRGVSVGSINGAALSMVPLGEEREAAAALIARWKSLRQRDVVKKRFLSPLSLLWSPSVYSFKPLRRYLEAYIDVDKIRASGRDYAAVAVDVVTGDFRTYGADCSNTQLINGILASSAVPILYPPVVTPREMIYDGGIRDVSPVGQAIAAGATEIDLVLTQSSKLPSWDKKPNRVWNTASRVFDIMFREIVEADLDRVELYNAAVVSGHPKGAGKRVVKMRVFRPASPLPADSTKFEPEQSSCLIDIGYEDARRVMLVARDEADGTSQCGN